MNRSIAIVVTLAFAVFVKGLLLFCSFFLN